MNTLNPSLEPLQTLFRFWLRFMAWGLRIAAVCLVVALPAVVAFDRFSPWPPAIQALSAYPGQSRICVGYGSDSEWTPSGSRSSIQRSFLLFPRAVKSPSIITITSTDGAAATVDESSFAFWFLFAFYAVALFFCIRLIRVITSIRHAKSAGIA